MAETNPYELPIQVVGPLSRVQVFPTLSVSPLMLTDAPPGQGHCGWEETNATRVEAGMVLNAALVCDVCGLPLSYPTLLRTLAPEPCTVMPTVAMLLSVIPSLALNVNESLPE